MTAGPPSPAPAPPAATIALAREMLQWRQGQWRAAVRSWSPDHQQATLRPADIQKPRIDVCGHRP